MSDNSQTINRHNRQTTNPSVDNFLGRFLKGIELNNLDDDTQGGVVDAFVNLLSDPTELVRTVSMEMLVSFFFIAQEKIAVKILNVFCGNVLAKEEPQARASSEGFKKLICDMTPENEKQIDLLGDIFYKKLRPPMEKRFFSDDKLQLKIFDIFSVMFSKFGGLNAYQKFIETKMLDHLYIHLKNKDFKLAQQAVNCLVSLAKHCNVEIFEKICSELKESLRKCKEEAGCCHHVTAFQEICAQSPLRFARHVSEVFDLVDKKSYSGEDFVEKTLLMHKTFLQDCKLKCSSFEDKTIEKALNILKRNDISSKVRREAVNLIATAIKTQFDKLLKFYESVAPQLILQFEERDKDVRVEVYKTYFEFFNQFQKVQNHLLATLYRPLLCEQFKSCVWICVEQLKEKNFKSLKSCLTLLKYFMKFIPDTFTEAAGNEGKNYLDIIIPGILSIIHTNTVETDSGESNPVWLSTNIKIESLKFLNLIFRTYLFTHLAANLDAVVEMSNVAIQDSSNQVRIEVLFILRELVTVIRPSLSVPLDPNTGSLHKTIFKMILEKLRLLDAVQEEAITSMSQFIFVFSNSLTQAELSEVFGIFLQCLNKETTRLTCLVALNRISETSDISFSPLFPETFNLLPGFLKQTSEKALQGGTLTLMEFIVRKNDSYMTHLPMDSLMSIFTENDIINSILALGVLTCFVRKYKSEAFVREIPQKVLPIVLKFVHSHPNSPDLLSALENFLISIIENDFPGFSYSEIVKRIFGEINFNSVPTHDSINAVGQCLGSLASLDPQIAYQEAQSMLKVIDVANAKEPELKAFYALSTLGFIGQKRDLIFLSSGNKVFEETLKGIMNSFVKDPQISKNFKDMIAHCLGGIAAGNLDTSKKPRAESGIYLKYILDLMKSLNMKESTDQNAEFIMLKALNVCLLCVYNGVFDPVSNDFPHLEEIWIILFQKCNCKNEVIRSLVADCICKVILLKPEEMLPKLGENFQSPTSSERKLALQTFVKVIPKCQHVKIEVLSSIVEASLSFPTDADMDIRRLTLNVFNCLIHNRPEVLREKCLDKFFDFDIYDEANVQPKLNCLFQISRFKREVDDNYAVRKATFESMIIMLEKLTSDKLKITTIIQRMEKGLKDSYDIRLQAYFMFRKLSETYPEYLFERRSEISQVIQETIGELFEQTAVREELEKLQDLQNASLHAVYALSKMDPNGIQALKKLISENPKIDLIYKRVQKSDSENAN